MSDVADYRTLFDLRERRALVIGGASGIGAECAVGLADHGAHVTVADVSETAAHDTASRIRGRGGRADAVALDITDETSVDGVVAGVGRLDALVCTPSVNVRAPLSDYASADFDRVIDLNLRGSFFVMRAAGRRMAEQGGGSIVFFSSIRALIVEPGQGAYAATKAATLQLVRALAAELGPKGVRANAIAPGVVDTPLTAPIKARPEWYRAYAERSALGRWAEPSELVGAAVFLASDASSFVTGSLLVVDGGWTAIDGRFTPPL